MIKHMAGLNLQKSAPEGQSEVPKRRNGPNANAGHFHAHLVSLKPQKTGVHPVNQLTSNDLQDSHRVTAFPSIEAEGREVNDALADETDDFQIANLTAETNQHDGLSGGSDQLPSLFITVLANHNMLTTAKAGSTNHAKAKAEQSPEMQSQPPANIGLIPACWKQGSKPLNQDLETAGKDALRLTPIKPLTVPETPSSEGITKVVQWPAASPSSGNAPSSPQNMMNALPVLSTASPSIQEAGQSFASPDVQKSGIRDLNAYFGYAIQNNTISKSLSVQIELPEIGKISARFGGASDAIAITLTTSDEKNAPAIAELQREMKIWLDQVGIESPGSAQAADMRFESPKEHRGNTTDQGRSNNGDAKRTGESLSEMPAGFAKESGNQTRSGLQSGGKWRLI
jgi:hypothetical protein